MVHDPFGQVDQFARFKERRVDFFTETRIHIRDYLLLAGGLSGTVRIVIGEGVLGRNKRLTIRRYGDFNEARCGSSGSRGFDRMQISMLLPMNVLMNRPNYRATPVTLRSASQIIR